MELRKNKYKISEICCNCFESDPCFRPKIVLFLFPLEVQQIVYQPQPYRPAFNGPKDTQPTASHISSNRTISCKGSSRYLQCELRTMILNKDSRVGQQPRCLGHHGCLEIQGCQVFLGHPREAERQDQWVNTGKISHSV